MQNGNRFLARGGAATLQGVALAGIALIGLVLFVLLVTAGSLIGVGVGLFLLPPLVVRTQRLANVQRRLAGKWSGVQIPVPYRPSPADDATRSPLRHLHHLLGDQANWRDALWLLVDSMIGILLTAMPLGLILNGIRGLVMPFAGAGEWLGNWYAFIPMTGPAAEWLAAFLGLVQFPLALWVAPPLLRLHARLAAGLLSPTETTRLSHRVQHLTETRDDAVGSQASELRRIERNLHDGAQARLVAMGMTLDAAMRVLAEHPEAARSLLTEAKDTSAKALQELRSLVRGIQPPVLVDRGLADAIRTLAMENPLHLETTVDIPGRPSPAVEAAAYFTVSEVLNNAMKHSGAQTGRPAAARPVGRPTTATRANQPRPTRQDPGATRRPTLARLARRRTGRHPGDHQRQQLPRPAVPMGTPGPHQQDWPGPLRGLPFMNWLLPVPLGVARCGDVAAEDRRLRAAVCGLLAGEDKAQYTFQLRCRCGVAVRCRGSQDSHGLGQQLVTHRRRTRLPDAGISGFAPPGDIHRIRNTGTSTAVTCDDARATG